MFIQLGDALLHCVVEGPASAPPLLLLHSIGTTQSIWAPQAAVLARHFRVIRPDLRGHGLSEVTPGDYSMASLAQDALGLLDVLGVAQAHIAGVSLGGRIAQQIAAEAPERVLSLLLIDTALDFPTKPTWNSRMEAVAREGTIALADAVMPRWTVNPSLPSSLGLRRMLLRTDRVGYNGAAAALRDAEAVDVVGRIQAPCTILIGERDVVVPQAATDALRSAIPGAALATIPGGGHIPNYEFAEGLVEAMSGHFTRLQTS
ncbi:putative 3-oxoadipate enol-lactonase [Acetobacteraceae bacterium AT-5844]|nr:putative 3-oxoadipate enol-lactonase [Acetobacteraceae bacterium AT-5844]